MIWTVTIPNYVPVSLNRLTRGRIRDRIRLGKLQRAVVSAYCLLERVPKALGRRRVRLLVTQRRGRLADPDNLLKAMLDSLVGCDMLRDDSARWCEWEMPVVQRGLCDETTIILEDL